MTIPSSASVTKAVLEVVYKSDHPSSPITAYVNGGTSVNLYEVAIAGGSSGEYVYRGEYIGEVADAYHNTASGHCGNGRGLQSLVVYAFRNQTESVNSSGQFTSISGYCDLQGFAIGIPTETQPRDLTMFLPVSELTTDGRFMTITATAGAVTSSKTIYGPPSGECCVDVVEIQLNNVAGNVNVIDIDIDTRSSSNPNGGGCGQSYVISGGIKVEAECPPPPCEDFIALAESDLNLVIDRTISNSHPTCQSATPDRVFWANCLFDETTGCPDDYKYWKVTGSTSFKEYTDGTAYLSMEIQNVENSNYRFDVEVIFEGRTQTPPTGSPKLGICTGSAQGDWYYYEVTEGSLIGKNGLSGAVLAIDRNGPAFQVGTGANLYESGKFGASGWLNYTIFEQPTAFNLSDNAGLDFNFLLSGGAFNFGATAENICAGETAQLNAYAAGGVPPYTFQWSNGLGSGPSKSVTPTSNTTYSVTVTDSEGCSGSDEVLVEVDECSSLGDKVWIDKNGNGKQDGGEPGLDGVTVQLKNASGTVIDTRTTSGGGMYLFDNLTGGTYSVGFVKPSGYEFTVQNQGADNLDSDPNPNTGMTANIILGSNDENLTVDAGLYKPASLGDYVWLDENKNGIQDGGEKALKDIVVKLFDDNNQQVGSSTLTNASGQYFFGDLAPGQYYVKFALPSGLMFTLDNEGTNDTKDSDVDNSNGSGTTPLYTLTSGEYDPDIDAGGKCTVTVDAGSDKTVCDGGCTEIKATASNGSGNYTYSWSHGLGNGRTKTVCPTTTTTYTVTVTDVNGCCEVTDKVTVTVNNNVDVNAGPDQTICKSTCADLEASASGGKAPYSYKWSSGQTTKAINVCPTSDKTYTVTVTDANGCTGKDVVKVKVYTNLTTGGKIAANQSNCGPFNPDPFTSITPASGGTGTTPIEYIWLKSTTTCTPPASISDPNWTIISGANGLTYDPGLTTQNTCFIRCARRQGCPDYNGESNVISITIHPGPSVHATASPAAFCEGGCSDLTANASGGKAPYSYKWSSGQTTKTINVCPTSDKSYTVTVTDANGCKATDKVDVTVYDNPVASAGPDKSICKNSCTNLTASGSGGKAPYSYKWSNGDNTKTINVCPTSDKTYTVTVTDANGCKDTDKAKVIVNNNVNVNAGPDQTICKSTCADLEASASGGKAPYSYKWSSGQTTKAINVCPTSDKTYTVTVTDANGCTGKDVVKVKVYTNLTTGGKIAANQSNCGPFNPDPFTSITPASGGTGTTPIEYIWLKSTTTCTPPASISDPNWTIIPGANGLTYDPGFTTQNTCFIRCARRQGCPDYNGESNVISITIHPGPSVHATASPAAFCEGGCSDLTANASGGKAPYSYKWSSGQTTKTINVCPTSDKSYTVTVTDANGCKATDKVDVTVYDNPVASAGPDKSICKNSCTNLTASGSGGKAPYSYKWSNGDNTKTINVCPTSDKTYTVTVTDANGCKDTDKAKVIVNNNVNVNAGPDQTICKSTCADLEASASGGKAPYSYKWSSGQTTKAINVCPTSDKTYTVTVTDANGCTGKDVVKVKVYTNLTTGGKIAANQSNCGPFNPDPFTSITPASGGTGTTPIEYIWLKSTTTCTPPASISDPNWTIIPGANGLTYDPGFTTQNTCFIRCARRQGCPDYNGESNVISITIHPGPSVHATASPAAFCEGGCSDLTANASGGKAPYSYKWSSGQTTKTINVCPTSDKSYTVTVTDANGCKATDKVDVTVYDNPVASAGPDQTICKTTCTDLTASASGGKAPYSYKWSNGDNTKTINVCPLSDKTYTVTVTDKNGCTDTDVVKVKVYSNLTTGGKIGYDQSNCGPFNADKLISLAPASGGTGTTPIEYIWFYSTTKCTPPTSLTDPDYTLIVGANSPSYDPGIITESTCFIRCARRKGCPLYSGESNIVRITIFDEPTLTATASESLVCESHCTDLTAHPSGGTAPYTYKWSNGKRTKDIEVCPFSTTDYRVTVTDANGCTAEANVKVRVKPCIDLELIKTVDNPTPPVGSQVTFTINVKNNGPSRATGVVIKDYAPNGYANLDASLSGGTVSGNNVTWTNQIIPNGGSINLKFKATVLIPGAGVKYQNLAEIYRADQEDTDSTPGNDPDTDGDGDVGPIDDDGSKDEDDEDDGDDATVMPYCDVVADAGPDAEICYGSCHDLEASATGGSGNYYYQWDNGLGVSATHQVCPSTTTTYSVTVTDLTTGCTDVDVVRVKVVPGVDVDAGKDKSICKTECVDLKAYPIGGVAPFTYKWSNGSTGSSIPVCPSASTSYTVTITDRNGCIGTDVVTVEVVECGSIGDFVWEDLNGNGMQDLGEPGISNVTVKLTDGLGNPLDQTTTNQDGYYLFDLLRAGSYRVMFVQPQNYDTFTSANVTTDNRDSDANQTTGMTGVIILSAGEDDLTNDAGLLNFASIGDYVWEDLNGNGIQEFGEPGVNGILVKLKDKYGAVVQSQTTSIGGPQNQAGYYLFDDLMPGEYSLEFEKPFGYDYTGSNSPGSNDTNDSDVDFGGLTPSTILTSGEKDLTFDAGLIQPGSIGDFVWDDLNIDGVQDPNEPGKNGISILLYTDTDLDGNPDELIDSEVSRRVNGKDGFYQFTDLKPGGYILKFVAPADCYPSPQLNTVGNDPDDSDADENTGYTSTIVVVSGSDDPTNDAGFYKKACIGNYVWEDANGDGIQDRNEKGIDGVDVYLYDENHNLVQSAVTSSMPMMGMSGWYKFCEIEPGRYYVKFDASNVDDNLSPTLANIGSDETDSDIDGTNGEGTTDWYELESGEVDLTADAGFIKTACIGDYVWDDIDNDGVQDDATEWGINGAKVYLYNQYDELIATTITVTNMQLGVEGWYQFCGIAPGDYYVKFDVKRVHSDFELSKVNNTSDDKDSDVTEANGPNTTDMIWIGPGDNFLDIDAAYYKPSSIGNYIWEDFNLDGIQNEDVSSGLNDFVVRLYTSSGEHLSTQTSRNHETTGRPGYFCFDNLASGDYYVEFEVPAGMTFQPTDVDMTNDNDDSDVGDFNGANTTIVHSLAPGQDLDDIDAGFWKACVLGNYVWEDNGGPGKWMNGIQDHAESGLEGVTVMVYDVATHEPVPDMAAIVTDSEGDYEFLVKPGDYYLEFTPPARYIASPMKTGWDNEMDCDVGDFFGTNTTQAFTLDYGQDDLTVDAGFYDLALSVDLLTFDAKLSGNDVEVTWTTLNEANSDYYVVERSYESTSDFVDIGMVDAFGNFRGTLDYQFDDHLFQSGTYYYRLRSVDQSGSFKHSKIVGVDLTDEIAIGNIEIYPNPTSGLINFTAEGTLSGIDMVTVYDARGIMVRSKTNHSPDLMIDLGDLISGVYWIEIVIGDYVKRSRLVISR